MSLEENVATLSAVVAVVSNNLERLLDSIPQVIRLCNDLVNLNNNTTHGIELLAKDIEEHRKVEGRVETHVDKVNSALDLIKKEHLEKSAKILAKAEDIKTMTKGIAEKMPTVANEQQPDEVDKKIKLLEKMPTWVKWFLFLSAFGLSGLKLFEMIFPKLAKLFGG